jgi:hypothetical protein
MLVCFGVGVFVILGMRFYLIWENKRRDAREGFSDGHIEDAMNVDLTDRRIPGYRYVY